MDIGIKEKIDVASLGVDRNKLLDSGRKAASAEDRAALKKSAKDFESIFVGMMLKSMRNSIQKSGFMDGGNAEDIYRSMLDQEYSKMMSETDRVGLSATIERQLSRAAGWENPGNSWSARISPLEKAKGLQAYGAKQLHSSLKESTIKEGMK